MATNTYIGPQGGNWFDPANWSTGTVPGSGDIAELFGPSEPGPNGVGPTGVDATAGTVSGLTIDLSGTSGSIYYDNQTAVYYAFAPNLTVDTIGSASAPVTIDVTADSGTNSQAGLLFDQLYGSINVAPNQSLAITEHVGGNVSSGFSIDGNVTIAAGASLAVEGYNSRGYRDDNPIAFNGLVRIEGGKLTVASSQVSGTGSIEIGDGGTAVFPDTPTTIGLPVTFDSTGGTLDLSSFGTAYTGTITGFGAGDTIIASSEFDTSYPFTTSYADGVLTITPFQAGAEQFHFAGNYTLANFDVRFGGGGIEVTYQPCFATGTAIATPEGECLVEDLAPGDLVLLAAGGSAPVTWIGHRRQRGDVIRVRAHALGRHTPRRDLIVSADHGLFLDGVLVQAGLLVDGDTIVREQRDEITFWHVELDRHAILLAEGAPAESYLDTGNRRQFANCALAYDPLAASRHEPCAEMVFAGARLAAIKARLTEVATAR